MKTIGGILNTPNGPRRVGTNAVPYWTDNSGRTHVNLETAALTVTERALLERIQQLELQVRAMRKLIRRRRSRR